MTSGTQSLTHGRKCSEIILAKEKGPKVLLLLVYLFIVGGEVILDSATNME